MIILIVIIAFILLALFVVAWVFYTDVLVPAKNAPTVEDMAVQMEKDGLLVSTTFSATRALLVAEANDEGAHFFTELENGTILYLCGQDLLEWSFVNENNKAKSGEGAQAVPFPSTDFTIRRHRDKGHLVDIQCRGTAIEVDDAPLPMNGTVYAQVHAPEDGEIITDKSYEELRTLFGGSAS